MKNALMLFLVTALFLVFTGCSDKTDETSEYVFPGVGYIEPAYVFSGRLNADTPNFEHHFTVESLSTVRLSIRIPYTGFYVLLKDEGGMIRQYWDSEIQDIMLDAGTYTLRYKLLDIWMNDVYLTKVWIVPEYSEEEAPEESEQTHE